MKKAAWEQCRKAAHKRSSVKMAEGAARVVSGGNEVTVVE